MKKILLSICLVLVSIIIFAQWTSFNPAPTSNDLYSVYFLDVNTGYVIGESGTILKTIDGGTHWTHLNSGTLKNLHSVCFTDLNTGYIVGDSGCILKTINGGTTWEHQSSGTSASLCSIYFPSDDIGYSVGDSMVVSTKDGGVNWTCMSLLGKEYHEYLWLNSVFFANADTGFAVGTGMWGFLHHSGKVYKTTNGGLDWVLCYQCGGLFCSINSAFFANSSTYYLCGYEATSETTHNHFVNKTTDGGLTWTTSYYGIMLGAIYFSTIDTGYLFGEDDSFNWVIQKTTDGGTTWSRNLYVTSKHLNSICFTDTETGYIVGENGTILKTTNGGGFVSINETVSSESKFSLYPNPATHKITISINRLLAGETRISIISISGQQLMQAWFQNQKQFDMDVSTLSKGIYLVKIQTKKGVETKKLVVQ